MAAVRVNKPKKTIASVPECPLCLEPMCVPIYQCKVGHSLCHTCTKNLRPPLCPICRQDMTWTRNFQLEEMCPVAGSSNTDGCNAGKNKTNECTIRTTNCPLNDSGKCIWNGELKNMIEHFKENHSEFYVSPDKVFNVETGTDIKQDKHFIYLTTQDDQLFVLTLKLDVLQKMAFGTIQLLGSKTNAQQYIYEIHVSSLLDNKRTVLFIDNCFNNEMTADEVFRKGKCFMLPLNAFGHFVKEKNLSLRFSIKKLIANAIKKTENKPVNDNNEPGGAKPIKPFSKGNGPGKGPNTKGSKANNKI